MFNIIHVIINLGDNMSGITIFLILIIIIGICGIVYITAYNKLQFLKTKVEQAENIADESLRDKYDQIVKINIKIKKETKEKKDYLKELDEIKNKNITNFEMDRKLVECMNIINAIICDNEKLENNKDIQDILFQIRNIDEKLYAAKAYYNKNTTEINELIRKFPSVIVAKIHKIKNKPYFDGKNMEDEIIDDFKL